jgi:hypothetical protein
MLKTLSSTRDLPTMTELGVPHLAGAGELGVAVQVSQSFALPATGSPHTISIASLVGLVGELLRPMRDATYVPVLVGDTAARVDLASRTVDSFDVVGGANGDVVAVVLIGTMAGMNFSAREK